MDILPTFLCIVISLTQKIWHSSRKTCGCIACSEVGMREFVLFDVLVFSPLFGCQMLLKKSFVGHYVVIMEGEKHHDF